MYNLFFRIFILIGLGAAILSMPLYARAQQWYDKIPRSGEYAPLPEPGTTQKPKDFDSLNVVPEDERGDASSSGSGESENQNLPIRTEGSLTSNDATSATTQEKPVGGSTIWWMVGIVGLIILALITAPFWLKRVFRKMSP